MQSVSPVYTDSGVFVVFEGGEGAGKSTQSALLDSWLRAEGYSVLLTREPGGTDVGAALRTILLDHATGNLSPRAEALMYAADKAEHVDTMILPALDAGRVVISDRYVDSTLAYQGAGRAIPQRELEDVARWATSALRPHLTVLLDVDPTLGLSRLDSPDRLESEPVEFHQRVREHFGQLAAADTDHYLVLDGRAPVADLHTAIVERLKRWLPQAVRSEYA